MVEHLFDTVSERLAPHLVEPRALTRHTLPVDDAFAPLFPDGGLVRGTSVALGADPATGGATSLALAVAAAPSRTGSWVAVAGFPNLGFAALEGCGMDPGHVLVVPRLPSAVWARALAVLVAAVDVVVLGPPSGGSSGGSVPPRAGARLRPGGAPRGGCQPLGGRGGGARAPHRPPGRGGPDRTRCCGTPAAARAVVARR
jgi:hypothetical protein